MAQASYPGLINRKTYQRSDDRTRLPDEFQTNQDQENVNGRVEAFARNAAHQQHTKPGRQNSERKENDRGEQVFSRELA